MSPASLLVVGLDAGDPEIVLEMAADGRLPTVAALLERGARAPMQVPVGLYVGALWASLFTGLTPGRHGRHAPRQLVPGTYDVRKMGPAEIRGTPLWAELARAGRKVAIVDVPHTAPIEGAADVQITEWGAHDPALGLTTWPPLLVREVVARFGHHPVHGAGRQCDVRRDRDDYVALRDDLLDGVRRRGALNRFLLDDEWDLFFTVFSEVHCATHQCWHLHDPTHPRHDATTAAKAGDVMEQVYIAFDDALRTLLDGAGDDTTVFVIVTHGAKPHYDGTFLLDRVLRRRELVEMSWRARRRRTRDERRWSRLSEDAQWKHPRATDRVWRGWDEQLPPLDPGLRPCFKVDNNEPYGGIRVNLRGREPRGVVDPADLDDFCTALASDLLELTNGETGTPAVRRVLRTAELYRGECLADLPDLLVEWDWSSPVRSLVSPKLGRIDGEYTWVRTGDHRPEGMLIAAGPGIAAGALPAIDATDVAPTIAARLGCSLTDVDGDVVGALGGVAHDHA